MKLLKIITSGYSSIKLENESGELIGELLFKAISGFKERIKINEEIFKIKNVALIGNDIRVFNEYEQLMIESLSKDRFVYFGNSKEFYTYKSDGFFSNKTNLFKDEELMMTINIKGFFKSKYEIQVADNFKNILMMLTFLNFYIRNSSSA